MVTMVGMVSYIAVLLYNFLKSDYSMVVSWYFGIRKASYSHLDSRQQTHIPLSMWRLPAPQIWIIKCLNRHLDFSKHCVYSPVSDVPVLMLRWCMIGHVMHDVLYTLHMV